MKFLAAIILVLLVGCETPVPVSPKFPDAPVALQAPCPPLEKAPADTTELSVLIQIVVRNYGRYRECALVVEQWQSWHRTQKNIFENGGENGKE